MIPTRSGSRIKIDRRDSIMLASLHRAGEVAAVYVPRAEVEAMRALVRDSQDAVKAERVTKKQLKLPQRASFESIAIKQILPRKISGEP